MSFSLLTALGALVLSYFHQGVSNVVGDLFGAMPIAKESAFPGLYPQSDLLVAAGMRGPFHVYKAAGWLYRWGVDVDVFWFCALLIILFLTFLAIWHLSFEATGNTAASSFAVLFLALANPWRGGLNWTPVPVPFLVTSVFALPIGYLALTLFLRRRYRAALLAAAVMFNIHPSAIILLVLIGSHILFRETALPLSSRLLWLGIGALAAAPNAVYTVAQLPGNFVATTSIAPGFFAEQFRIFGYHAFIEDHWREGYGWFFLNCAALVFFLRYLDERKRRQIGYTLTVLAGILAAYILNLYVFQNRTITLLLLFRVTFFIKPLMFAVVTYGLYRWFVEGAPLTLLRSLFRFSVIAGFLHSLVTMDNVQSELVLLLSLSLLFAVVADRGTVLRMLAVATACWGLFEVALLASMRLHLVRPGEDWSDLFLASHILAGLALLTALLLPHRMPGGAAAPSEPAPYREGTVGNGRIIAVLVLLFLLLKSGRAVRVVSRADLPLHEQVARRAFFSRPAPVLAPLVAWARQHTPKASLFAVPPIDTIDTVMFAQLRIAAERGVYITLFDIYQLAYDVEIYREGIDRLNRLGVRVLGRHRFDDSAYHDLSKTALRRLHAESGVGYAVFEKAKMGPQVRALPFTFSDDRFVVVDIGNLPD